MSEEKIYYLLGPDRKKYPSKTKGKLGGHYGSRIYGRLDCPTALRAIAKGGYVANRVFFADEEAAIAAGFRPCGHCMRERYETWKRGRAAGSPEYPLVNRSKVNAQIGNNTMNECIEKSNHDQALLDSLRKLLDRARRAEKRIDVLIECEKDVWNDPNRQYVSLYNVILGPKGARGLFAQTKTNESFLANHGACRFVAASEEGIDEIVATDGLLVWVLSRATLGGGSVRNMSISSIRRAVAQRDLPSVTFASLTS